MTREEAFRAIVQVKEVIMTDAQERDIQTVNHGKEISVEINGKSRQMLYYSGKTEMEPVCFYIHGGGFCCGTVYNGDRFCHQLNKQLGYTVYSLDYPLTPDAVFPEALHWLYETISYMVEHKDQFHIDPDQMVISGQSAGGTLAAALTLLAKERGEFQFACQVLDYPPLDLGAGIIDNSKRYFGTGAMPEIVLEILYMTYADIKEQQHKYCSPLAASLEELRDLPPAVIQTCEMDSLRPDGDLYAERLKKAGVPVISHCYPGALHGFTDTDEPEGIHGRQYLINGIQTILEK